MQSYFELDESERNEIRNFRKSLAALYSTIQCVPFLWEVVFNQRKQSHYLLQCCPIPEKEAPTILSMCRSSLTSSIAGSEFDRENKMSISLSQKDALLYAIPPTFDYVAFYCSFPSHEEDGIVSVIEDVNAYDSSNVKDCLLSAWELDPLEFQVKQHEERERIINELKEEDTRSDKGVYSQDSHRRIDMRWRIQRKESFSKVFEPFNWTRLLPGGDMHVK